MFFHRLFGGSFKKMKMHIDLIHKETGKNRVWLFFDMAWCIVRYRMGYSEYHCFGFALVRGKERRTFVTMNDNITLSKRLNSREDLHIFDDKGDFDRAFSEFVGREWLDLRRASKEDFLGFCENKSAIFAKVANGFGGAEVMKVELSQNEDLSALYERLTKSDYMIVEEELTQHEKMKSLAPSSVNTVRIATLNHAGTLHVLYSLIRISNGQSPVDNVCHGGMYTPVDGGGVIRKPAYCTATGEFYDPHPFSKTPIVGFEIPYFNEAVEMVKKAAMMFPKMEYLGWDVAITPTGPVLIEANNLPSYDLAQNYGHLDEKVGIKPKFEEILGKDFFK